MTEEIHRLRTGPRMSKIVQYAGLVFLSGQTSSGLSIPDIVGQTREVLNRIDELLAEAGSGKSRLLSATIYLRDITDFDAMNIEWEAWMAGTAAPTRTTVEARLANPHLLVEISVIAAV
jgi:enamine deaminase RidA (YjgF/YER057c/UK114 family)